MKRNSSIILAITCAFCAGVSVSFFTLPVWVTFAINFAREGNRSDWLGFGGNIIGGVMTISAAAVGYLAIKRQLRIGLISREEDRIEIELPGLRQVKGILDYCSAEFAPNAQSLPDPSHILSVMRARNLITGSTFALDNLKEQMPEAKRATLYMVFNLLSRIVTYCVRLEQTMKDDDRNKRGDELISDMAMFPPEIIEGRRKIREQEQQALAVQYQALQNLLKVLRDVTSRLNERVDERERQLIEFRDEIETHFQRSWRKQ